MKRGNYDGGHGGGGGGYNYNAQYQQQPNKRPRATAGGEEFKFESRVLVPSKVAGSLIGQKGANIQKLRQVGKN